MHRARILCAGDGLLAPGGRQLRGALLSPAGRADRLALLQRLVALVNDLVTRVETAQDLRIAAVAGADLDGDTMSTPLSPRSLRGQIPASYRALAGLVRARFPRVHGAEV